MEETKKVTKEKREGKSLVSRIINIVLWVVLIIWVIIVVFDFIKVRNEEEPSFCWFNGTTTTYNDGTVTSCTGLGYKVINYNRESFKAIEFGPFWIKDRTAEKDNK